MSNSYTKSAVHNLAACSRTNAGKEVAGVLERAREFLDYLEDGKTEYCFPDELAGAVALVASCDSPKKTIFLVTGPENVQRYKEVLGKIFVGWNSAGVGADEPGCEGKYAVCGADEYRQRLENARLPKQRKVVYSRESQAAVFNRTVGTLTEEELLGVIDACDAAFSTQSAQWKDPAVKLGGEIRSLVNCMFVTADAEFNDVIIRRNLTALLGLVKEIRALCFDGVCARDRGTLTYPLSDLICKIIGFMELNAHYGVTGGDGGYALEFKINRITAGMGDVPAAVYRNKPTCPPLERQNFWLAG